MGVVHNSKISQITKVENKLPFLVKSFLNEWQQRLGSHAHNHLLCNALRHTYNTVNIVRMASVNQTDVKIATFFLTSYIYVEANHS